MNLLLRGPFLGLKYMESGPRLTRVLAPQVHSGPLSAQCCRGSTAEAQICSLTLLSWQGVLCSACRSSLLARSWEA